MIFKKFCTNVAIARENKGLSAYELSLRLGKDSSYIHKLENGKINISLKMIIAISETLEVPIEQLFTTIKPIIQK